MATATDSRVAPMPLDISPPELGNLDQPIHDPGSSDQPADLPVDVSVMSAPKANGTSTTEANNHVTFDNLQLNATTSNDSFEYASSANTYTPKALRAKKTALD